MEDPSSPVGTQSFTKFCPTCKFGNDANAIVCAYCGSSLDLVFNRSMQEESQYAIPINGLAFYFAGTVTQIAITTENEVVLGRKTEDDKEPMIDLTEPQGFAMGVSRHHAKVSLTEKGYVITDMNSSNGTWLDGKALHPNQPIELPSGATIQLGKLKLVAIYNLPRK